MHEQLVHLHAQTLHCAKYHLRTQNGYSAQFYSHEKEYPIFGSGQGSGNSPFIWLFISSTLCDAHCKISTGANFISPDGQHTLHLTMVGFVDDCTGTCNDFRRQHQAPTHEIASIMTTDAQNWNDLLWSSGGKLELPKCSFHVLEFQFSPDGTPIPVTKLPDCTITLHDPSTKQPVPITPKASITPHKTLGHWKAPADNRQRQQLQDLKAKA